MFNFCHFSKKSDVTPVKNEKIGQKINFPESDWHR